MDGTNRSYGASPRESSGEASGYTPPSLRTPEQIAAIQNAEAELAGAVDSQRPAIGNSDEDVTMVIAYIAARSRGHQEPLEVFCRQWRQIGESQ
jgi:hypothetical protein